MPLTLSTFYISPRLSSELQTPSSNYLLLTSIWVSHGHLKSNMCKTEPSLYPANVYFSYPPPSLQSHKWPNHPVFTGARNVGLIPDSSPPFLISSPSTLMFISMQNLSQIYPLASSPSHQGLSTTVSSSDDFSLLSLHRSFPLHLLFLELQTGASEIPEGSFPFLRPFTTSPCA